MKNIRLVPYTPGHDPIWNAFVENSNNGTMFHRTDFLSYHQAGRFDFQHFLFYADNELLAVIPGARNGIQYRSPTGASFGSIVHKKNLDLDSAVGMVRVLTDHLHSKGIEEISLTPPMQAYYRTPDESIEYALIYNGYQLNHPLYSSVIDLSRIKSRADLSVKSRYNVNKAERSGTTIIESKDFESAYHIIEKNKEKFSVKPTHTLDELKRISDLLPNGIVQFVAYHNEVPIAVQVLFIANSQCATIFYSMHLYEYRNLYAVNLLVDHSVRWCVQRGFQFLDFGVSADTFSPNPLEPSWPLVQFKESVGGAGCIRKTYIRKA